jgi:hypothetical protein
MVGTSVIARETHNKTGGTTRSSNKVGLGERQAKSERARMRHLCGQLDRMIFGDIPFVATFSTEQRQSSEILRLL